MFQTPTQFRSGAGLLRPHCNDAVPVIVNKYFMMAVDPLTHFFYPAKSELNLLTSRETIHSPKCWAVYLAVYHFSDSMPQQNAAACLQCVIDAPIQYGCVRFDTPLTSFTRLQDGTEKLHDNPSPSPNHGPAGDTAAQLQRVDSKYVGCMHFCRLALLHALSDNSCLLGYSASRCSSRQ